MPVVIAFEKIRGAEYLLREGPFGGCKRDDDEYDCLFIVSDF